MSQSQSKSVGPSMNEAQFADAQNDIADFFTKLIGILTRLVEFFNGLKPRTRAVGTCEAALLDSMRAEAVSVLSRMPGYVQSYIACKFGGPTTQAFNLGQLLALFQLVMKYLPQLLDLLNQLGGLLPPTTPGTPSGDYTPTPVDRCQ